MQPLIFYLLLPEQQQIATTVHLFVDLGIKLGITCLLFNTTYLHVLPKIILTGQTGPFPARKQMF